MRYIIGLILLCLFTDSTAIAQTVNVRLPIGVRITNSRRSVTVTTPTPYQILGQCLASSFTGPEVYELKKIKGRAGRPPVPSDGWVRFTSGRDKYRLFVIDPNGLVGSLCLLSEHDPSYRQEISGPRFRIKVPNRPGGPENEAYYLVLEYQGENERRIFEFTVENSAPPDLGETRW